MGRVIAVAIIVDRRLIGLSAMLKLLIVTGLLPVRADVGITNNYGYFGTAAIVYGAYWRHDVGNDELESG